ncbi:MAG: VCBS repeat-containing protein [Propionibacteriaceae bacterium]|nr:VCBS repeat-containing protein [Propionibacteriaceae bacterium]
MAQRRYPVVAVLTAVVLACTAMGQGAGVVRAGVPDEAPASPSDFNGDGYADLAVGAPGNARGRGLVNVIPGGSDGLRGTAGTSLSQASLQVAGTAGRGAFGTALASADFNRDGYADLAVGSPSENGRAAATGGVSVFYGSSKGLQASGGQHWPAASSGLPTGCRRLGIALAAGDFDGNGYPDLAMGADDPGAVLVVRGSTAGLSQAGVVLAAETYTGGRYGNALAAGDLNGDGAAELIVGAPGHDASTDWSGAVFVHAGSRTGLSTTARLVTPDAVGITDAGSSDFGGTLGTGDFDTDGFEDLAIGAAEAGMGGLVAVLPGSAAGVNPSAAVLWTQDSPGVPGVSEIHDSLGGALAAGDVVGDAADDLVIGIPGERLDGRRGRQHGAVLVIPGMAGSGLSATGARGWTRDTQGVPGKPVLSDRFGAALAIANYTGSAAADLVIGTPGQSFRPYADGGGSITLLPGEAHGLTSSGSAVWSQASPGIAGSPGYHDHFGAALTP